MRLSTDVSHNLGAGYRNRGIPVFVEPLAMAPMQNVIGMRCLLPTVRGSQIIVKSTGALVDLVDWCNERAGEGPAQMASGNCMEWPVRLPVCTKDAA